MYSFSLASAMLYKNNWVNWTVITWVRLIYYFKNILPYDLYSKNKKIKMFNVASLAAAATAALCAIINSCENRGIWVWTFVTFTEEIF